MSRVKIVFSPFLLKENKYIEIMQSIIRENGYDVYPLSKVIRSLKLLKATKIIHLNWFENIAGGNYFWKINDFVKKTLILLFFKLLGKKLIWTMHNKLQHDLPSLHLQNALFYLLVKWSNRIIIHSNISREILRTKYPNISNLDSKIKYIPHPDYINSYGKIIPSSNGKDRCVHLLFLGMIRQYKNIELLVDIVNSFNAEDVHLHIAGNFVSKKYLDKILEQSLTAKNVSFDIRYIPDSSISLILSKIDLVVLPYDIESSLNSGSAILAFSYKKTVICPEIGTIADLTDFNNVMTYKYNSYEEHFCELKKLIKQAVEMKKKNQSEFNTMGENAYNDLLKLNSKENVKKKMNELYFQIL